ncbi:hypothetical protein EDD16DRAFT_1716799 [Pisolithus croceorrhizus]|nr:hypothetical protein EDD16DRAFT_1716799 [Pisolithus croceorrhizus]
MGSSRSFMPVTPHDSDNEVIHVYTPRDRGKRKADGSFYDNMSVGEIGSSDSPEIDRGGYSLSSKTPSMDVDRASTNMSDTAAQMHIMPSALSSDDESLYESLYESAVDLDIKSKASVDDDKDVDVPPHALDRLDLASSIKGLAAGGLVDKIVISQNTLETFLNIVCPGAYASVTKVNFKALDQYISFGLLTMLWLHRLLAGAEYYWANEVYSSIRSYTFFDQRNRMATQNRSLSYTGLKRVRGMTPAPSQVRRNRVTFMRYLIKMCDQVVALISSAHAQTIVWNEGGDDDARDDDDDGDAIINCIVDRTTEQEESVQVREGFKVKSGHITHAGSTSAASVELGPPRPFLLFGETAQGFMTTQQQAAECVSDNFRARSLTTLQLESHLASDRLCLSQSLDGEALNILVHNGLRKRFPDECAKWERGCVDVEAQYKRVRTDGFNQVKVNLDKGEENLTSAIHEAVIDAALDLYPFLERESFRSPKVNQTTAPTSFRGLVELYPQMNETYRQNIKAVETISNDKFRDIKERLCLFAGAVSLAGSTSENQRREIAKAVLKEGLMAARNAVKETLTKISSTTHTTKLTDGHSPLLIYDSSEDKIPLVERAVNYVTSWMRGDKASFANRAFREALPKANDISDSQFLKEIVNAEVVQEDPELRRLAHEANMEVQRFLATTIPRVVKKLVKLVRHTQEDTLMQRIKAETASREEEEKRKLRLELIRHVNDSTSRTKQPHSLFIDSVEENKSHRRLHHSSSQWRLSGMRETQEDPATCFTVHIMSLTEQDKHNLRLDASTVLTPHFRFEHKFRLTEGHTVLRAQLLEGEKLLLVVSDRIGNLIVYLDHLTAINAAIARGRGKSLNREKIGQDFVLAFDESKRMLGIVSSDKLLLHIFVHDDARGLRAQGSSINLNPWYNEGTFICHSCFVGGSEELLLVDSQAQARIYSLGYDAISTRDSQPPPRPVEHTFYTRWVVSAKGIQLNVPGFPVDEPFVVTSLVSRTAVHLLWLDFPSRRCQSYALDITRRVTEFMFRETVSRGESKRAQITTAHNCLVDCHSEVWIRFPALAAVQRETISSASLRSQKSLVFVTDRDFQMFAQHFSDMICTFERTSKKPTGDVLKSIKVSAAAFSAFVHDLCGTTPWNVSQYRAGEWIVDFLCLIPIHIALTRENRFIPLKDGVYSTELERLLLGAEVNRIVDSISFGWYESLFQSYMATKPVRVVSSMGEQSVGKSYALNHLVDTSFAGSAMRTTEGVWMSVTPTEKELIVALDFEGVHSIERSAQEDTLLVLFNTAISNLVLFRNNFALSRDIAGLFQSFQSSATVLDPAANPSLFQSTLVIIIKDVVEADRSEIAREFTLKFQQIVQDEQETNFITRLHAGKLAIIPWPVIESQEFYKRFPKLKRHLDQQVITHHTAGEFLHTVKTLMAKLKANDWGAMSQTMASHRAQLLSSLLPNALAFGFQEVDPEREPLKVVLPPLCLEKSNCPQNLDTDKPVELPDTESQDREQTLEILRSSWERYHERQNVPDSAWVEALSQYLDGIVNLRIDRVQEWLSQNLARFQTGHASTEELRRDFEGVTVDLRTNVQLCKLQCADCQLLCIQSRFHDGPHACQTNHLCIHECDFCRETIDEFRECGMSAGHAGKTHVADHSDEHLCAASVHACGKLIWFTTCRRILVIRAPVSAESQSMSIISVMNAKLASARSHVNSASGYVPIRTTCMVWKWMRYTFVGKSIPARPCVLRRVYVRSQQHHIRLKQLLRADTKPSNIQSTRKVSCVLHRNTLNSCGAVAKRLKCVKPVPPGATEHEGSHNHSLDKKVRKLRVFLYITPWYDQFKFTFFATPNERCIGHPQQEHETRHGSMSRTRWTIDGPDDGAALEIEGKRFSTNDEGAPMMCNLVCQAMGRHVHIDYCRSGQEAACVGNDEIQHITRNLRPDPDRPKDFVTHNLFWKRSGFKDPYSKEEQAVFAKCDAMCSGPEHAGDAGNLAQPSHCTLPMFHPLAVANAVVPTVGYISNDGHHFTCRNPVIMQQAFHVIFVADRSRSMRGKDRRPLQNTPASSRICARFQNRFGAVLSSLFSFWSARAAAITSSGGAGRRDAYSVILFHHEPLTVIENDFTSNPDQLLDMLLPHQLDFGTNFTAAITAARTVMMRNWSAERSPVIIFLSDGESSIADQTMQGLCRSSVRLGKAVSFHAVSFGPDASSRSLRRMTEIAIDAQNNAPRDPLAPAAATVMSSYNQALDSVIDFIFAGYLSLLNVELY